MRSLKSQMDADDEMVGESAAVSYSLTNKRVAAISLGPEFLVRMDR